jgi:hypothetical protein
MFRILSCLTRAGGDLGSLQSISDKPQPKEINMKKTILFTTLAVLLLVALPGGVCQETGNHPVYEYATARFMGADTSIIWPDGNSDKVVGLSSKARPETADTRMFYLTLAMNIMGKRGFSFVHMEGSDLVMQRVVGK